MNPITIALIAYNIIAEYAKSIGEPERVPFDKLTDEQKQSYVDGVNYVLANPEAGPSAQHDMWLIAKQADGWTWGEVKDEEKKTHPAILPFEELPESQRAKDSIFRAVVLVSKIWVDSVPTPEPKAETVKAAKVAEPQLYSGGVPHGFTPVKYIGKRPTYLENTYSTGILFTQGGTELVPSDKAVLLFKHPDQYVPGEVAETKSKAPAKAVKSPDKKDSEDTEDELQQARDLVASMDVDGLKAYAQTHYQQKLHHNVGLEKARAAVTQLIDQYGLK